jgi:hypothetical protein
MEEDELSDDVIFDDVDLIHAFAGGDRFHDGVALADAAGNTTNSAPAKRTRRGPVPWRLVATFTGATCAAEARDSLRHHSGSEWFESKGKVRKSRDTVLCPGIPLAQTPRVNRDGTSVSEAKCPFFSVLAFLIVHRPSIISISGSIV